MSWRDRAFLLLLAAALTLANAVKPAVVDDTAYLEFARHLSANPTDPYGFRLFWYDRPEPAMHVLLPPVLPYWVAGGMRLVGASLFLLKLWLFPFAGVLVAAVHSLMRRFAPASARVGTTVFVLSPAVLPLFNVMLDVPALALGLAGLAAFVRGCDRRQFGWVVLAGVLVGLAMQTKYSMLVAPAVLAWYGFLHRRWADTLIAVGLAAGLFAG
ncbi:MAG: glycosyltransferase family 39 protein, partial [Gemmataceae bacterium]